MKGLTVGDLSDRNVYILGAGFSAAAGAPLVHDFLDRSRQLFDDPASGLEDFERESFKKVFAFRQQMAQAREKVRIDLDDVEQLFGLVEISHRLGRTGADTRNATVYVIAKTLELTTGRYGRRRARFGFPVVSGTPNQDVISAHPDVFQHQDNTTNPPFCQVDVYDYFAALLAGIFDDPEKRISRKDTVITFNYDLVLDSALRRIGIGPDYHLDPKLVQDSRGDAGRPKCDVLKLHGSTNWGVCGNCRESAVVLPSKLTDSPRDFRAIPCPKCGRNTFAPLLIPPSWDKSEYREIIAPVWRQAIEELRLATRICVIGYSMLDFDAFFKYLLTLALSENHQLYKLIVVDYRPPAEVEPMLGAQSRNAGVGVARRYRKLLDRLFRERRFSFSDEGFTRFCHSNSSRHELGRGEALTGGLAMY